MGSEPRLRKRRSSHSPISKARQNAVLSAEGFANRWRSMMGEYEAGSISPYQVDNNTMRVNGHDDEKD
jgi:hypothetical protein